MSIALYKRILYGTLCLALYTASTASKSAAQRTTSDIASSEGVVGETELTRETRSREVLAVAQPVALRSRMAHTNGAPTVIAVGALLGDSTIRSGAPSARERARTLAFATLIGSVGGASMMHALCLRNGCNTSSPRKTGAAFGAAIGSLVGALACYGPP